MVKIKSTEERGKFKQDIQNALYKNDDFMDFMFENASDLNVEEKRALFRDHVKSHLFIDDTIEETTSYIFYDVRMPSLGDKIKKCEVLMYVICHRDILDKCENEKFIGNRADILSQIVENTLVANDNSQEFGIGQLSLDSVDIYNSKRFYGCIMRFSVFNFR